MAALDPLENKLNEIFVKQLPALPDGGKKFLVSYLPYINLILGVIVLFSVVNLWRWATVANDFIDYANRVSEAYGGTTITGTDRLGPVIWLAVITLGIQGLLYVASFPGTKAKKKSGWNLMFYALIVNVLYGIVMVFSAYGGIGSLFGSLIGTAIGLYLLFQIRSSYSTGKVAPKAAKTAKKA